VEQHGGVTKYVSIDDLMIKIENYMEIRQFCRFWKNRYVLFTLSSWQTQIIR
jgi:hypothetical protein